MVVALSNAVFRFPISPQLAALRQRIHSLSCREKQSNEARLEAPPYMKILQPCVETKAKRQGQSIHSHVIINGFDANVNLSTKLIIFYTKVGDAINARKVFDRMPERSVVSWTAQISGYTGNGYYKDALLMFLEMRRAGVKANQFTYGSLLRACSGLGCLEGGMQIQGCIQKSRFAGNLFVQSALVDFHSKCGSIHDACHLFGATSERDVVSWNAMIGGCAAQGFAEDSFRMFCSMIREGMVPDFFTLGNVLKATCRPSNLGWVHQIHVFITKLGLESNAALSGSLIDAYVKSGSLGTAYRLYKNLQTRDVICCTALMTGFAQDNEYSNEALDIFREIRFMHMKIDNVILCLLLNICANMASLCGGRQIHALALKNSRHDVAIGNALIDMYAKSGEIGDANRAFGEMAKKNVISWTSLIAGYGKNGYGQEAVALFKKMEHEKMKPNDITFLSLLFACSHTGLTHQGGECFNNMTEKYDILPRAEHFSSMADLLARRGQLEDVYDVICKLNVKPNASLWGAILGACSVYGNTSLGSVAAGHLFNMDPENSVSYVALSNIYAAAGAWNSVQTMRRLLKGRHLRKSSGYSLLQCAEEKILILQPS